MEWCVGVAVAVKAFEMPNLTRENAVTIEIRSSFDWLCPAGWRRA